MLAIAFTSSLVAHGAFASQGRGGGDIQCDAEIKKLSANLLDWISAKGPETGKLNLASSLNPVTGKPYSYSEYEAKMTSLLNMPLDVSCVKPGDKGYPVSVNDSAKICATFVDFEGVHMTCDRGLFLGLNADQRIEQNHHEFSINIPGLEPDSGAISTYKISDQLSASIGDVTERRLIVNRCGSSCPPQMTAFSYDEAANYFKNGTSNPDMSVLPGTNWILVGLAASPDTNNSGFSQFDPNGIKDATNKLESSLQFCGQVGGDFTANLFNVPGVGNTGPLVLSGYGIDMTKSAIAFSFPAVLEATSQYGTAVCRLISGTNNNLLCAVIDINDPRYSIDQPSDYVYYVKR